MFPMNWFILAFIIPSFLHLPMEKNVSFNTMSATKSSHCNISSKKWQW